MRGDSLCRNPAAKRDDAGGKSCRNPAARSATGGRGKLLQDTGSRRSDCAPAWDVLFIELARHRKRRPPARHIRSGPPRARPLPQAYRPQSARHTHEAGRIHHQAGRHRRRASLCLMSRRDHTGDSRPEQQAPTHRRDVRKIDSDPKHETCADLRMQADLARIGTSTR
jgi:hypothetical protein